MDATQIIKAAEVALPGWLAKQRWFSSGDSAPQSATVVDQTWIVDGVPGLLWTLMDVDGTSVYQVPIGVREKEHIGPTLLGFPHAHICEAEIDGKTCILYDGMIDSPLARAMFKVVFDGQQEAATVRPVGGEQSNTSLVFDNRTIVKFFRRLYKGRNPDLEVSIALTEAEFAHIAPVSATWQRGEWDLAVAQPYLFDGSDGWNMAMNSVRDFLRGDFVASSSPQGSPNKIVDDFEDPSKAGGNFGNEAHRLGRVTAELHLAMAKQFDTDAYSASALADSLMRDFDSLTDVERKSMQNLIDRLREVPDSMAGRAIRIHGDYHFGQTLRSTSGWYVFDFEGEPARPLHERRILTSPLKDVAGMLRSVQYAGATGLSEQTETAQDDLAARAESWESYNCGRFREGYFSVDGIETLMPSNQETRDLLLRGFEVEKALYELAYERAYRPDWVSIPHGAIRRLLAA